MEAERRPGEADDPGAIFRDRPAAMLPPIDLSEPGYPLLLAVARYAAVIPTVVVLAAIGLGLAIAIARHQPWWLAVGVLGAAMGWVLARLMVEIVRLLVETLIPQ